MFEMPAPLCLNWVSPLRKEAGDRNKGLNVGEHRYHLETGMGEVARINLFTQLG